MTSDRSIGLEDEVRTVRANTEARQSMPIPHSLLAVASLTGPALWILLGFFIVSTLVIEFYVGARRHSTRPASTQRQHRSRDQSSGREPPL